MGVAESWRTNSSRYLLEGSKCLDCNKYFFPILANCGDCMSTSLRRHVFSDKCKLIEFTRIEESASGFEHLVPYYYGIVELDEGIKVSTQIVASSDDELELGMELEMTFRQLSKSSNSNILSYGFKAQPIIKN
jgi:uncharacterized protein